jgi:hypothetical protein
MEIMNVAIMNVAAEAWILYYRKMSLIRKKFEETTRVRGETNVFLPHETVIRCELCSCGLQILS